MSKHLLVATPKQVLGPYFLEDSPLRKNLDLRTSDQKGEALSISGQVLNVHGQPLADAIVHVWLADRGGRYDNQADDGSVIKIAKSQHRLRGRVKTGGDGKYAFKCHRPGNYALDAAQTRWRPGHIHIKVVAPGHKTLITQLYFEGDEHNEHDLPGPEFFRPELIVKLTPDTPKPRRLQHGCFNLVLEKE